MFWTRTKTEVVHFLGFNGNLPTSKKIIPQFSRRRFWETRRCLPFFAPFNYL